MSKESFRSLLLVILGCSLLAACGDKAKSEATTQVAAKVNGDEITVHQVGFALQRANVTSPDQMKEASRQALDRLIEQDLLVQAAVEKKLDRDPRVVQAIEAAKREVIARAYLEQAVGGSIAKPGVQEIKAYYDQHPALFSERRIYEFREIAVQNVPQIGDKVRAQLAKSSSLEDLVTLLKSGNVRFADNAFSKPAEQLPLESLSRFHSMKDGEVSVSETPQTLIVLQLVRSISEPVSEEKAKPLIEQFLVNQKRAETAKTEIQRLRGSAKIELAGEFAANSTESAAKAPEVASSAAAGSQQDGLEKGLKGLK